MNRNLNPNQLRMFVPAGEIVKDWNMVDADRGWGSREKANEATMDWKLWEARQIGETPDVGPTAPSLEDRIRDRGIQKPVISTPGQYVDAETGAYSRPTLGNGHHRVAVAHSMDPNMLVPVIHSEGIFGHSWEHTARD